MKIVIVIPPSEFLSDDRCFPYLGPVQIATALRDLGRHVVKVIDLTGHAQRCSGGRAGGNGGDGGAESARGNLVGAVSSQRYEYHDSLECEAEVWRNAECLIADAARGGDVAVFGTYALSCQVHAAVKIRTLIQKYSPHSKTVLGGPHVAMAPEAAAIIGFDHVVADLGGGGGGEAPTLDLMRRLALGLPTPPIVRAELKQASLHRWPWPDRDFIDIGSYDYRLKGEKTATIVTQRGCPYACTFCSHTSFYRKIEYRDEAHVAAELRELRGRYNYRAVMLYDDETNISGPHFEALCHVLGQGEWIWRGFIKSNLFTAEQAKRAAASGAVQLCTGGESMNPEIKLHIQKKSTVDDDTRFVQLCLENGIAPKIFSMIGLAGESEETAQQLEDWLVARAKDGLRDADVTVYTPYPGTPMWDSFEKSGAYAAPGGKHGLRLVHQMNFAGETTHYKGRTGQYLSRVETFDPATGKTLMTAEQIVAARDRVEANFRAEVARQSGVVSAKIDG